MVVTEEEEFFDTKLIESQPREPKIKHKNNLGLDGIDFDEEPEVENNLSQEEKQNDHLGF